MKAGLIDPFAGGLIAETEDAVTELLFTQPMEELMH